MLEAIECCHTWSMLEHAEIEILCVLREFHYLGCKRLKLLEIESCLIDPVD